MATEIGKLYESAEIKCKYGCTYACCVCKNPHPDWCKECKYLSVVYPSFTAEKQLEIVKFLLKKSVYYDTNGDREYWFHISNEIENSKYREFDEALAECVNKMWEDLRDYEKVQIQEIIK